MYNGVYYSPLLDQLYTYDDVMSIAGFLWDTYYIEDVTEIVALMGLVYIGEL